MVKVLIFEFQLAISIFKKDKNFREPILMDFRAPRVKNSNFLKDSKKL